MKLCAAVVCFITLTNIGLSFAIYPFQDPTLPWDSRVDDLVRSKHVVCGSSNLIYVLLNPFCLSPYVLLILSNPCLFYFYNGDVKP